MTIVSTKIEHFIVIIIECFFHREKIWKLEMLKMIDQSDLNFWFSELLTNVYILRGH